MSDKNSTDAQDDAYGAAAAPVVSLGGKMPQAARRLPVVSRDTAGDDRDSPRTEIAEGLNFSGNAVLGGVCTVKGRVDGNLKRAEGAQVAVIVTETGHVKGDIVADQISIMGRTEGLLDATGGSVTLHDSANVSGHVRYFRIQVNGSDLNATLERAPGKPASAQAAPPPAAAAPADPPPGAEFPGLEGGQP